MSTREIKINKFQSIAEDKRDLPNGFFHYLENVNTGDFEHSAKQVPNVYNKTQDQCILKLLKYGTDIYGLGYENSTTKDTTLYLWDNSAKVFNAIANSTVAGGTVSLYTPFLGIMAGVIYFDTGAGYLGKFTLPTTMTSATFASISGGMAGGTLWQGALYGWGVTDNNIYKVTSSGITSMITIPADQTPVQLVAYGNYLQIICTASATSNDGISRMYTWDGVTTTTFADIVEIGRGVVSGGDILDGLVYALIGFPNLKGFRLKAYSGGVFQTVYTYFGKPNKVSSYLYARPASLVKAYTGYLYFMIVGARPGSSYTYVYEAVLFRYGKTNIGQGNKLSVYKSLDVTPTVGNTLGILGNDFIISEDNFDPSVVDNSVYAVVYEGSYKTRQVYTVADVYSTQPGLIETCIYTGGDSSVEKKLKELSLQCVPLTSGQSITLYYKPDADTSWTEIVTIDTVGTISYEPVLESSGSNLRTSKEVAFKIEELGGAELTAFKFIYEPEIGQQI
jgi:hypothetical protein